MVFYITVVLFGTMDYMVLPVYFFICQNTLLVLKTFIFLALLVLESQMNTFNIKDFKNEHYYKKFGL